MNRLERLESDSLQMIRSIWQICTNPIQLWSTGKDSTLSLYLVRKAFEGRIPWKVFHLDTGRKFPEIYKFRDDVAREWAVPLVVATNKTAMKLNIGPDTVSKYDCCTALKTQVLKNVVKDLKADAVVISIRHDEHYVRGMEDLVSLRDEKGNWQYWGRYGGFGLNAPEQHEYNHIRIHPILPWTEADVWEYTWTHGLPVNPLYYAKQDEGGKWWRYRSLGCMPCTSPIESSAVTVQQIVNEVYLNPGLERSGRLQDKESATSMLRLRALGYM